MALIDPTGQVYYEIFHNMMEDLKKECNVVGWGGFVCLVGFFKQIRQKHVVITGT